MAIKRSTQTLLEKYGEAIKRRNFKALWQSYMDSHLSYGEYREKVFQMVREVRAEMKSSPFDISQLEEGWQYRVLGIESYNEAFAEMLSFCFGWW